MTFVVMNSQNWEDLTKFMAFKRVIGGAVAGGLYFYLHSELNYPNSIMTFVTGWWGMDFIEKLVQKYQARVKPDEQGN